MTLNFDVSERNGKNFGTITDLYFTTHLSDFRMNFNYTNIPSAITSMVSGVVNSNWRIMKPLVDPTLNTFISGTFKDISIQPIFNRFDLQEIFSVFYNMNSTSKNC